MRITRHLLLAIVLAIVAHTAMYAQKFTAADLISTSGTFTIAKSKYDNSGNLIMAGYFTGSITIGGRTAVSAGGLDIFVACFNTSMTCYQLLRFGGSYSEYVNTLTTDASNNIYFGGRAEPGSQIGTYTFNNPGAYIVKLNSSGTVQFVSPYLSNATTITTTVTCGNYPGCGISATTAYYYINTADISDISVDGNGNIYFAGTYTGSLTETGNGAYGTTTGQANCAAGGGCGSRNTNYTIYLYYNNTAFAGKINSSGTKQWTKKYFANKDDNTSGNTINVTNNTVYFTYYNNKDLNLPKIEITRLNATNGFNNLWTKSFNSTYITSGSIDSRHNFVFSGYYVGKSNSFYTFTTTSTSISLLQSSTFLHRFDSSGNTRNAMPLYSGKGNYESVIYIDGQDRIYVSGATNDQIYTQSPMLGKGGINQFVLQLDSSFKVTRQTMAGGDTSTFVLPLAIRLISSKLNILIKASGKVSFDTISVTASANSLYRLQLDTAKYTMPAPTKDSLVSGEYFFNTDPGVGKGKAFTFTTGVDTISAKVKADISTLPDGFNNLFVRIKSKSGKWSLYEGRVFYKQEKVTRSAAGDTLVKAEYFFDNDPGIGKGTAITFTPAKDSVTFKGAAKINSLSDGFHNLFVRVQNKEGKWSHYEGRTFFKRPAQKLNVAAKIVDGEYFFNTDPGIGKGTKISPAFTKANIIDITRLASTSGLAAGKHRINIRLKDSLGKWSLTEGHSFTICSNPLPIPTVTGKTQYCPGETIQLIGSTVTGASSYLWKGPNNFTSTQQNISITNITAAKAGKYTYVAIRSGGTACDTSSPVTVNVVLNAPGSAQSLRVSGPVKFCADDSVVLSTDQISGYRYQWLLNGANTPNAGDTLNNLVVKTAGTYNVRITNTGGCTYLMRDTQVTVFAKPLTSSITGNNNVLLGTLQNYSVTNKAGSSYAWFVTNGNITTGNGTNSISIQWPNTAGAGTIKVVETNSNGCMGDTVTLNITISNTTLTVTPLNLTYLASGASKQVSVTSNTTWTATTDQPGWVTINPANGSGNGNVNIIVAANPNQNSRKATVTFTAGSLTQIVNITQDSAGSATLAVTPLNLSYPASGDIKQVTVTSNSNWAATTDQPSWVALSSVSGIGNGNVDITVSANPAQTVRTAKVTFTSGSLTQIVNITQDFTTGIAEVDETTGILVYPNPSTGMFTIENTLKERSEVKVFDATGRIVDSFVIQPSGNRKLDYSHLPSAVYIINVITTKGVMIQRLVIAR